MWVLARRRPGSLLREDSWGPAAGSELASGGAFCGTQLDIACRPRGRDSIKLAGLRILNSQRWQWVSHGTHNHKLVG